MPVVLEPMDGSPKCECLQPHIQDGESDQLCPFHFRIGPESAYFP